MLQTPLKPTLAILLLVTVLVPPARSQSPAGCMPGMMMPGCPAQSPPAASPLPAPAGHTNHGAPPATPPLVATPLPDLLAEVRTRKPLALEDFLQTADRRNPTLAQASALARKADALARQAALYPNPLIGYQGEQIRGGSFGGGEQGGYLQQTIVLGGKLGLRRDIYTHQKAAEQLGFEQQRARIRNEITRQFYTALTAQSMIDLRRQLLQVALDAVETVHQLANVGQADAPDILQTEVEAEQAKLEDTIAQQHYLSSFAVLAALSGQPGLAPTSLLGTLETPPALDLDRQLEHLVSDSPTILRMQQQVRVAEARLRDARREVIPDLTLRAGEQYNGERLAALPARPAGPQSFASASIDLPLWNRNQGTIEAAQADLERAQLDVTRTTLALRVGAAPLQQSYLAAQLQATRYRDEILPRARKAYELYFAKYRSMASAYPQVLVSHRTLLQLQIAYLESLRMAWLSAASLQNFTATGALEAPQPTDAAPAAASSRAGAVE